MAAVQQAMQTDQIAVEGIQSPDSKTTAEPQWEGRSTDVPSVGTASEVAWPLWKLCVLALPQMGVQVMWAFLGPNSAPYMLHLGMGPSLATLNNIAGPLTGFFTGPIVGAVSDSSTSRFGRRRPVILAGLISTWVAALLYGAAPHVLPQGKAVFLAAPMAWVMDVTVNILQTPHRALVSDLASHEQQIPVQVVFVVYMSVGNFIGYSLMRVYPVPIEHMFELLLIICALNTLLVLVQFSLARETPLVVAQQGSSRHRLSACQPVCDVLRAVAGSPMVLYHLAFVQGMLFIGATAWSTYSAQWFDNSVFGGDVHAPSGSPVRQAYVDGTHWFTLGGMLRSAWQLVASLAIIAVLLRTAIRARFVYAGSIFVGAAVSALAAWWVQHNRLWALLCLILSVMPEVGAFSIPFGLLAVVNKHAAMEGKPVSTALQMSLLNCCVTIGQQLCTVSLAALEGALPLETALPICFAIAALSQVVGGLSALFLDDGVANRARGGKAKSERSSDSGLPTMEQSGSNDFAV